MTPSAFTDIAALYVGLGWQIIPLLARGKAPATPHGYRDRTDDADTITRWARSFRDPNIGVVCGEPSGIAVIDVDPRNGGDDTLEALAGQGLTFPRCPQVRTGNGGTHLYLALPDGLRSSAGKLGLGIDIKSSGGYVVAPPSVIAPTGQGPGGAYYWVNSPTRTALPAFPRWALERLAPKAPPPRPFAPSAPTASAERRLEGIAAYVAGARQGERNHLLNWAAFTAGALVRKGELDARLVEARLTEAALAAGLPPPEIRATLRSGLRGALEKGPRL